MDKIFKASNGLEVRDVGWRLEWRSARYPDWRAVGASTDGGEPGFASDSLIGEALAEFFQHRRDESDVEQIMRAECQRLAAAARREAKSSRGLAVMHIVGAALAIPVIAFSAVTGSPWIALLWVVIGGLWTWTAAMYRRAARSWIATAETWEGIDRPAD